MNKKTEDWEKKTRDTKENWCQFRVKKLTFRALALLTLTLETSAFLLFTVANLRFQLSC